METNDRALVGEKPKPVEIVKVEIVLANGMYQVTLHVPMKTGTEAIQIVELLMEKYSGYVKPPVSQVQSRTR